MAREFILRASIISDDLTRAACEMILSSFGGFYATEGAGGYTFQNSGGAFSEIAPAISWHIGTAAKDSERFEFVSRFAATYCRAGNQESIYFLDIDGSACLVDSAGHFAPIV